MELCLHTKLLAPPNTPIADFLNRAPQPPSFMVTRAAVQVWKLSLSELLEKGVKAFSEKVLGTKNDPKSRSGPNKLHAKERTRAAPHILH